MSKVPNYSVEVMEAAAKELNEELFKAEVEECKKLLIERSRRYARLRNFWALIKAAFKELRA